MNSFMIYSYSTSQPHFEFKKKLLQIYSLSKLAQNQFTYLCICNEFFKNPDGPKHTINNENLRYYEDYTMTIIFGFHTAFGQKY